MEQFKRFGTWATAATVAVMFTVVTQVAPLLRGTRLQIGAGLAGILVSVGIYRLMASALLGLFHRSRWVRKRLLGPTFLEGTWVGFFPHSGSHHFTVEFFDQESGRLKITGREFDAQGKTYATWKSYASEIDLENGRLVYAYSCDVFARGTQQQGIGVFDLVATAKGAVPHILDGYAADLIDGDKDPNREYKIDDGKVSDDCALQRAHEIFIEGKRPAA